MRKFFLALMLVGLASGAVMLTLWFAFGLPTDGVHVIVNDHELNLAELRGTHAVAASLGLLVALCVVALVLPLTLLMGVLLPLLLVIGALLLVGVLVLGAGTLALAPVLLPLLLVIWLWRRSRRTKATPGTTIDA